MPYTFENKEAAAAAGRISRRGKATHPKARHTIVEVFAELIKDDRFKDKFVDDLYGLDPEKFLKQVEKFLEFITPKQQRTIVVGDVSQPVAVIKVDELAPDVKKQILKLIKYEKSNNTDQ